MTRNDQAVAVGEARRYLERHGMGAPGAVEMADLLNAFFPEWRRLEVTGDPAPFVIATPADLGWYVGTNGE